MPPRGSGSSEASAPLGRSRAVVEGGAGAPPGLQPGGCSCVLTCVPTCSVFPCMFMHVLMCAHVPACLCPCVSMSPCSHVFTCSMFSCVHVYQACPCAMCLVQSSVGLAEVAAHQGTAHPPQICGVGWLGAGTWGTPQPLDMSTPPSHWTPRTPAQAWPLVCWAFWVAKARLGLVCFRNGADCRPPSTDGGAGVGRQEAEPRGLPTQC